MLFRIAIAAVLACVVAGCGSATRTITQTRIDTITQARVQTKVITKTVSSPPASVATKSASKRGQGAGRTLSIQDFNGNTLDVAIPSVIDPATPANNFSEPDANTRFVGIHLTLTDKGPGSISDDADSDIAVIGSDDQDYTPAFGTIKGCTDFNHGTYALVSGSSQDGCVTVQLPTGVTVKAIQFSLGGNTIQFNA